MFVLYYVSAVAYACQERAFGLREEATNAEGHRGATAPRDATRSSRPRCAASPRRGTSARRWPTSSRSPGSRPARSTATSPASRSSSPRSPSRVLEARRGELDAQRAHGEPLAPGEVMATLLDGMRREPFGHVIVQLWAEAAVDPEIRELVQDVFAARPRRPCGRGSPSGPPPSPVVSTATPRSGRRGSRPSCIGVGPGFMMQRAIIDGLRRGRLPRGAARGAPPLTRPALTRSGRPQRHRSAQMPCHAGLFAQAWR